MVEYFGFFFVLVSSFRVSRSRVPSPLDVEKYAHPYVTPGETLKDMLDQSSGSGSGLPLLVSKNRLLIEHQVISEEII